MAKGSGKGGLACDIPAVLQVLSVIVLIVALAAGIAAIVDVANHTTTSNALQTCNQAGLSGNDCVRNFNAQFDVAVLAGAVLLFAMFAILAEFKIAFIREHATFLVKFFGRGLFLIFIGLLTLGLAGDLGLAAGISNMIVGGVLFLYSFCSTTST